MRTEGFRGALPSILVIASLIAPTISLLSLSLAFAETGQSPPLRGRNLVIVQAIDANSLDIHRTRLDSAYQVITLVHDTLMTFDWDMNYIPLLAESWEVDPDGLYIDFHLRKDVKFHCGHPFNADAVVYTIERAKGPWSAHADSLKNLSDAEALDEYTIRIHLKQQDRWLHDWFATTSSSIVCPRCAEEYGLDYGEKFFCGTGPFKVKEWIREDRLLLERNENYRWGPVIYQNRGPAHLEGITFEVIPTHISREEKFKEGEADMMVGLSPRPALVDWLNTTENVIFIINVRSSMSYVGFHVGTLSPEIQQGIESGRPYPPGAIRSPVSDDPEGKGLLVRKALLYATHRENLVLYAWDGMGKVAYGPLTSVIWGYDSSMEDMYPYDPEMARSLLAQAGYAEGLELTVLTTNYESYTKTAQVLKAQWADVGVTLNIEVRVFDDIETIIANANHDLWVGGWTWHNADMLWWYWHTVRVPPPPNRFWWGNAYTDAVIENTFLFDDTVAYKAIQEVQRLIMEDAAYLPVVERPFLLAHWDKVKGFRMHPLSNLVWKHLDAYLVDEVDEVEYQVGVKADDWIKYDYTVTGTPSGTPLPIWMKVEFLSVEGTNATVRVTMHMSDGTEDSETMTVDVAAGGGTFGGLSGFVIPANSEVGDSITMTGYGTVTIGGEITRTYAGASRTVVYTSFSQYGTQLTYYWDKQTGVMVEASISDGMTGTGNATETNIWQAGPLGLSINPILLVLVAVIAVGVIAFVIVRRKRRPTTYWKF